MKSGWGNNRRGRRWPIHDLRPRSLQQAISGAPRRRIDHERGNRLVVQRCGHLQPATVWGARWCRAYQTWLEEQLQRGRPLQRCVEKGILHAQLRCGRMDLCGLPKGPRCICLSRWAAHGLHWDEEVQRSGRGTILVQQSCRRGMLLSCLRRQPELPMATVSTRALRSRLPSASCYRQGESLTPGSRMPARNLHHQGWDDRSHRTYWQGLEICRH